MATANRMQRRELRRKDYPAAPMEGWVERVDPPAPEIAEELEQSRQRLRELHAATADEGRPDMTGKPVHTVPDGKGGWINKTEGASRGFDPAPTKQEAEAAGRDTARNRGTEHLSHRRDGTIGERRSYGNDPHPPRG